LVTIYAQKYIHGCQPQAFISVGKAVAFAQTESIGGSQPLEGWFLFRMGKKVLRPGESGLQGALARGTLEAAVFSYLLGMDISSRALGHPIGHLVCRSAIT
jgi:hypothetical protein